MTLDVSMEEANLLVIALNEVIGQLHCEINGRDPKKTHDMIEKCDDLKSKVLDATGQPNIVRAVREARAA